MKIIALDLGDAHIGVAIADELGITCQPLTTLSAGNFIDELIKILHDPQIKRVVVGLPMTMKGTESQQTEKIRKQFYTLQTQFPQQEWVLWDERLSSKQAAALTAGKKGKKDKLKGHAIAAALILQSYVDFLKNQNQL